MNKLTSKSTLVVGMVEDGKIKFSGTGVEDGALAPFLKLLEGEPNDVTVAYCKQHGEFVFVRESGDLYRCAHREHKKEKSTS